MNNEWNMKYVQWPTVGKLRSVLFQCSFYYIIFEAWTPVSKKDVKIEHVKDRHNKPPTELPAEG